MTVYFATQNFFVQKCNMSQYQKIMTLNVVKINDIMIEMYQCNIINIKKLYLN